MKLSIRKCFDSGRMTLIISNVEMNDIMNIVKSLEESGLLIKDVNETTKNEVKEQKGGFLSMLLSTLGSNLLGSLLTGKGVKRLKMPRQGVMRIKDGAYVINLDEYESVETHWIALYVNGNNIIHFDSFGVERTSKQIQKNHRQQKYCNKYL